MPRREPSEALPLLPATRKSPRPNILGAGAEHATCILFAFPTAVLNGLAAVSGEAAKAGGLRTPADLVGLLEHAGAERIAYGVVALTASQAALYFLNKRYLLASGKASVDLLRRSIKTMGHVCCREDLRIEDRAGIGENILFFWSIATSLIFAEMGGKALSFLEMPGEIIGFSLSLAVYFATRFASAKIFLDNIYDKNWRLKQKYAARLELLREESVSISVAIDKEQGSSHAAMRFLNQVDEEWERLPKDLKRVVFLQYVAPILGYALMAITTVPIMAGFMPESVQGTEMITHVDIGASSDYQSPGALTFGAFATALTLFFYELNIKDLPKNFLRTALSIYEKMVVGEIAEAMKLFGLTLLALGSSYLTGIGFKFVADTAVTGGYLSYLGDWLSSMIPDGLLIGVTAMLWSHLQELINQPKQAFPDVEMAEPNRVDIKNVLALLDRPEVNISTLRGTRSTLFYHEQSHDVEGLVNATQSPSTSHL